MERPQLNEGTNPLNNASLWSRITMGWMSDYIRVSNDPFYSKPIIDKDGNEKKNKKTHTVKQLGTLFRPTPEDSKAEQESLARCEKNFQFYVTKAQKNRKTKKDDDDDEDNDLGDNYALLKTMFFTEW